MHLFCPRIRRGLQSPNVTAAIKLYWITASSVSIVTKIQGGWYRVRFRVRAKDFPLLQNVQIGSGTCLASSSMVIGVLSRGKSYQGEFEPSPPPTAEVKIYYDFTTIPQEALMTLLGLFLYHFLPHHLPMVILFNVRNTESLINVQNMNIKSPYVWKLFTNLSIRPILEFNCDRYW